MGKYLVSNVSLAISVGGEVITPEKDGSYELTKAQAEHLGGTYMVTEKEGGKRIGDGNAGTSNAAELKSQITKESLLALTKEELAERCKSCAIKVQDDWSKGDMAEAVLKFIENLDRKFPTTKKK